MMTTFAGALFDTYTTKSERTKRKKAEETAGEKAAQNEHRRINYRPDKRKKAYNESPTPTPTPTPTPVSSPQKRPAPSQAGSPSKKTKSVLCQSCRSRQIDVDSKLPKKRWVCNAIGKVCVPRKKK